MVVRTLPQATACTWGLGNKGKHMLETPHHQLEPMILIMTMEAVLRHAQGVKPKGIGLCKAGFYLG